MKQQLDIVVGDFGRPGTLRYLDAFSTSERRIISSRLPAGVPFFDEHREVQMVVLCQLRQIKRKILEPYFREGRQLDEGVLIGFSTGVPVVDIVPPLAKLLAEHINLARKQSTELVRIVFPCNTIGQLAKPLKHTLDEMGLCDNGPRVQVAPMQPQVARVLQRREIRSVRVLGTPASVETYRQILEKPEPAIRVLDNSAELIQAYEACIEDAIRGDKLDEGALAVVQDNLKGPSQEPFAVLEACTDISLGVGLDALEIYAESLANTAYGD